MIILNNRTMHWPRAKKQQYGFSLFVTLIALLVMSLAAAALIRTVDTNTVIAGNLAFKQTATSSADTAVEAAIDWLEANNGVNLESSQLTMGYVAEATNSLADPVGPAFWDSVSASACLISDQGSCVGVSGAVNVDSAGNQAAYIIHRLCATSGQSTAASCVVSAGAVNSDGGSIGVNSVKGILPTATYYRVLVRVTGPQNATSFVQAIVSL